MTMMSLEKIIFFFYLILLPFEAFHPLGLNSYGAIAKTPSFLFFAIGVFLAICNQRGKIVLDDKRYLRKLTLLIFSVSLISIIMAIILYYGVEPVAGFHTTDVIWSPIFYNIMVIVIIYYVFYMSERVNKEFIDKVLKTIYVYTVALGYIQLVAILGNGACRAILYGLESVNLTYSPELCLKHMKVVLMFSEPSYAEILLCGLLMPFICGNIIVKSHKTSDILKLLLLMPLVFFNGSSSVLLGTVICIAVTLILSCVRRDISGRALLSIFSVLVILALIWNTNNPIKEIIVSQILVKPFDNDNLSTIQRGSIIRNCIMVFLKYPILGVGNGVQGFFYESHLRAEDYKSYEVLNTLKYENGVPGAGSWAGGWLSGYGLVGTIFLIVFIVSTFRAIKQYRGSQYYYAYIIGGICFLICGWFTASTTGGYLSLFVLSIPTFSAKYFEMKDEMP